MEVAIVSALLGSTLPWALTEVSKRLGNNNPTDGDLDSLNRDLQHLSSQIKDYRKFRRKRNNRDTSAEWTNLIADLKDLAYNIEDCADRFNINKISKMQFDADIRRHKQSLEGTSQRLVTHMNKEQNRPQVVGGEDIPHQAYGMAVGVEGPHRVLDELVRPSQSATTPKLNVVAIVGSGCVGATLLAEELFSNVSNEFHRRTSVISSEGKTGAMILREIYQEFSRQDAGNRTNAGGSTSNPTLSDLQTCLRSCIRNYRYLIRIDAVWREPLADVIEVFRKITEADGIIIATMTLSWAPSRCSYAHGHVYKMTPFDEANESANLLMVEGTPAAPSVPVYLWSISQFCVGVKGDISGCDEHIFGPLCQFDRRHDEQRLLDSSYEGLDGSLDLQACLLYFCLFPDGRSVRRESLIRRWLAEGPEVGGRPGDKEESFKALLRGSAVGPVQASADGLVKACRPPPMTRGYICNKSRLENFVMASCGDQKTPIRRLSLHHIGNKNNWDDGRVLANKVAVSCLRTLAVSRRKQGDGAPALRFENCQLLRVLDLEDCPGVEQGQLNEIFKLQLLKFLSLQTDGINSVPSSITKLQFLQTLDLGKGERVVRVHVDVILLPRLRHLLGRFQLEKSWESLMVPSLYSRKAKESELETLAGFVTREGRGFPPMMRHMNRLRKVKIWFNLLPKDATSLPPPLEEAIAGFLCEPTDAMDAGGRRSLSLDLQDFRPSSLRVPAAAGRKLFSLKLRGNGSNLPQIPEFVAQLGGVTKLCLSWTTLPWECILAGLRNLPGLLHLRLVAEQIKGTTVPVAAASTEALVITNMGFENLQRMSLVTKKNLPKIDIASGALKNLESLHLICKELDGRSADEIKKLSKLKEVALHFEVDETTKQVWQSAATAHPNTAPYVRFIEDTRCA